MLYHLINLRFHKFLQLLHLTFYLFLRNPNLLTISYQIFQNEKTPRGKKSKSPRVANTEVSN